MSDYPIVACCPHLSSPAPESPGQIFTHTTTRTSQQRELHKTPARVIIKNRNLGAQNGQHRTEAFNQPQQYHPGPPSPNLGTGYQHNNFGEFLAANNYQGGQVLRQNNFKWDVLPNKFSAATFLNEHSAGPNTSLGSLDFLPGLRGLLANSNSIPFNGHNHIANHTSLPFNGNDLLVDHSNPPSSANNSWPEPHSNSSPGDYVPAGTTPAPAVSTAPSIAPAAKPKRQRKKVQRKHIELVIAL
ncbi:hypothetical protein Pst134EA_013095 [Puccinia striiformis f. sp. tritici]|uniref:hypothetical protein n=1 Tax=Puccinia striiformis f. sp. tritici TaxID=168172 RepID=UPI002008C744|nr:hypothetical protein Pst134EA_013095 [Puccinia striiformis f. sp. tritici]KAH9465202.1 hypothetical protein Pst134EA_013095 [Puccinia striiformis f. sp. tritici]KAI9630285.1 hypothetical protein KEM48_014009 [Puccinia striiformis f. sp. tritici PST-130]